MRAALAIVLAVGALVAAGPSLAVPSPAGPAVPTAHALASQCVPVSAPKTVTGTLSVAGQRGSPPTVAGVALDLRYSYLVNYTPRGGSSAYSCVGTIVPFVTDSQGAFRVNLTVPQGGCGPSSCVAYQGPFAPVGFSLQNATPAGYEFLSRLNGSVATLRFVNALDSLQTDPAGRATVSVAAPVAVTGLALAGDGSTSPAAITWSWRFTGSGWSMLTAANASAIEVEAASGAGPSSLFLWANGTFGGLATALGPVELDLAAAATQVTATAVVPTALDAGSPAEFGVNATGATGYSYRATFFPGLGRAPVGTDCASSPSVAGIVSLGCSASIVYNRSGTASPSVTVTNGYSSATAFLPQVLVDSALELGFTVAPAATYPGRNVSIAVQAAAGTGTAPYGPACLTGVTTAPTCADAPSGSAQFSVVFSLVGTYHLRATIADAAGANASATTVIVVSRPPSLDPIVAAPSDPTVGQSTVLTSALSGGAFPVEYWWNSSVPDGTFASGTMSADAIAQADFAPSAAGRITLTLTVVDAVGTRAVRQIPLWVEAGPATSIGGTPAELSTTAGAELTVPWEALDPALEPVVGFATALTVQISRADGLPVGPAWVNASGAGGSPAADGRLTLPASAWSNGRLNVTLTFDLAGQYRLVVSDAAGIPFDRPGPVALSVSADPYHLRLRDPLVAQSAFRSNSTLWQVVDRYGNAEPSGFIVIRELFAGQEVDVDSPVLFNGTVARAWVNYSLPGTAAGLVSVYSEWGESLLGPMTVAAAASPDDGPLAIAGGVVVALGVGALLLARHRRRRGKVRNAEEELERFARGRAAAQRAVDSTPRTLAELRERLELPFAPGPEELTEWLQSLLAEGLVDAQVGSDRLARYVARVAQAPVGAPRIELDPALLDSALARGYADEERSEDDGERPTRS